MISKKIIAKEYLILMIIIIASLILTYIFYPKWGWNNYLKESVRFWQINWESLGFFIGCYLLRFTFMAIKIFRSDD